ncbi:M48 family metalloprotease [Pseudomonas corrugata]|uniref:M48 family metalloprotease n=1 Tax=Pseudomonas corrugata TaxID=47879 RepID=UPI0004AFA937|nr:M48 family metalloprotease [Pseudomonas corrugata]
MDAVVNPQTNIDDVLRQERLDMRLKPSDLAEVNPWFLPVERDLSLICQQILPKPVSFTFSASPTIQACIVYRSNLVVMTAGMFNVLCRLASKIVSSGAFVVFEGGAEPTWTPNVDNNFKSVTSGLSSVAFDWNLESRAWKQSPERMAIFAYVLKTLSRFVVLHELGHAYHNHGIRFQAGVSNFIDVDMAEPELTTNESGVASQAREVIADNFAFNRLRKIQEMELARNVGEEATSLLVKKLLQGEQERVSFLLTMAYLYFHMMDRRDWHSQDVFKLTHPPSPFRLKHLFALTLENGIADLSEDEVGEILSLCHYGCNVLVSLVYNQYPLEDLFEEVSGPRFDKLFNELYKEYPKWQNLK